MLRIYVDGEPHCCEAQVRTIGDVKSWIIEKWAANRVIRRDQLKLRLLTDYDKDLDETQLIQSLPSLDLILFVENAMVRLNQVRSNFIFLPLFYY